MLLKLEAESKQARKAQKSKQPKGNGGEDRTKQMTSKKDIIIVSDERKIELIDDFCLQINDLIDYIKNPDKNREIAKTKTDERGYQVNLLARKIWPKINFNKTGLPYQSTDIPESAILHSGTIFSISRAGVKLAIILSCKFIIP